MDFTPTTITLRDRWDVTPLGEDEFRLGPYSMLMPPDSIAVDQYYGPTSMSAPTLRQPNSSKFASGKLMQSVILSFIFPHQGDEADLESCTLLDFIVLFKGMPFCPVENKLLNETYGIDALAFQGMELESIPNYPNSYRVTLRCQSFNWKVYLNGTDFASLVDYNMLLTYLARGKELYLTKAKQEPFTTATGMYNVRDNYRDFDLKFMTTAPVQLFYDTDAISAGDSLGIIKDYLKNTLNLELDETDPNSIANILNQLQSIGLLSESGELGAGTSDMWSLTNTNAFIQFLRDKIDPAQLTQVANQFLKLNPSMSQETAMFQAAAYLAQIALDELKAASASETSGSPLHSPTPPYTDETTINLVGLNLSKATTVASLTVSMGNLIASLPLQMAEGNALQYLGGDDSYARIVLIIHGEEDLNKLTVAFRLNQAIVRATKSVVGTGFIGLDSPLTVLCGMRTFLPISMKTSTMSGYPHAYSVVISLVDFDLYQQDRERLKRINQQDELASSWAGHPSLRLNDQADKFNLYPDLYLEHTATGWEQPDLYFIATPEALPSTIVSNQNLAFNNAPEGTNVDLMMGPNAVQLVVNGNAVPFVGDRMSSPDSSEGTPTHNSSDLDFGQNLRDSYADYCSSNLRGYMKRAFPTFFFALIDEPRQMLMYRTYTDFYSRRGVSQIIVNRSINPTEEVAIIQLSDIYRRLSFDPLPKTNSSTQDAGWWASTLYRDLTTFFTKIGDAEIEAVELQPGMRVHLRMGYSNNINDLKTVFNGTITEITPQSGGAELSIVAQGDGRELLGVINTGDKGGDTADVSGLFYSEPRELVIRLLCMRSSVWRNALSLMSQGAWHPDPRNGIRHFGELLPMAYDETTMSPEKYSKLTELRTTWVQTGLGLLGGQSTDMNQTSVANMMPGPEGEINIESVKAKNVEIAIDNASLLQAVSSAIESLWKGWDQNLFSRNIYPGTDSGLIEDFHSISGFVNTKNQAIAEGDSSFLTGGAINSATNIPNPAVMTGGGGGNIWDQVRYALGDAFDFLSKNDEPSFKAYTYMRTTWDIIQQCADLVPNYITAVRPFMHRSTLFFGKPFWKYTSGVRPYAPFDPNNEYRYIVEPNIDDVVNRMGYYKVKVLLEAEDVKTSGVFGPTIISPADQERASRSGSGTSPADTVPTPSSSGPGFGTTIDGTWLNQIMSQEGGKLGSMNMGPVIAAAASKYNVPWELLMSMIKFECSYMGVADNRSFRNNNPGNLNFASWEASEFGAILETGVSEANGGNRFGRFPTMTAGINAMARCLSTTYRTGVNQIIAGDYLGGMTTIGYVYYPPFENSTEARVKQQANYMQSIKAKAVSAGATFTSTSSGATSSGSGTSPVPSPASPPIDYSSVNEQISPERTAAMQAWFTGDKYELLKYGSGDWPVVRYLPGVLRAGVYQKLFIESNQIDWSSDSTPLYRPEDYPLFEEKVGNYRPKDMFSDPSWANIPNITKPQGPLADVQTQITDYFVGKVRDFMLTGPGLQVFEWWLDQNPGLSPIQLDPNNPVYFDPPADNSDVTQTRIVDFITQTILEIARQKGIKVTGKMVNGEIVAGFTDANGAPLNDAFWQDALNTWFLDKKAQEALVNSSTNGLNSPIADFFSEKFPDIFQIVKGIINIISTLGDWVVSAIQMGIGLVATVFNLGEITAYMSQFSKIMADELYNSNYAWGINDANGKWISIPDNPFSREFGEPVVEIREPFCKFHKVDSMRNIISNNISVSDAEVYPVVTSVTRGSKGRTVYADKSISPEFQKELVYENYLNFDILNFRDGIHAKRIGLAACARSIRTMYQGSIDVIGDCRMEPWDLIYIADVVSNVWGTANIREVTHTMSADMGYVSQVAVMPIVAVDDPAQWAVSTIVSDWFKRIFNYKYDETLSARYYGMSEVEKMTTWVAENPDKARPEWYDIYLGAGLGLGIVLFAAAAFLSGGTAPAALVGTMGATGLGGILNPGALTNIAEYFDMQQDVWVSLLNKNGEPYQAGLTGATGIVVGRQKSVGLDILDLFAKEKPLLTDEDLYKRMGMSDVELKFWQQDMQMFRGRALADIMTQEFVNSVYNSKAGYIVWNDAVVTKVIDGDTISVMYNGKEEKIRFAGVDAPEVVHKIPGDGTCDPTQLWLPDKTSALPGIAAWNWISGFVKAGDKVKLYIHPQFQKETAYDRWMAFVETSDGKVLNLELIKSGNGMIWGSSEKVVG